MVSAKFFAVIIATAFANGPVAHSRTSDITIHSHGNYQGAWRKYNSSMIDFETDSSFVNSAESWRSFGYWIGFYSTNFTNFQKTYGVNDQLGSGCQYCGTELSRLKSIRLLGAPDYSTPALSLYSGTKFEGVEHYVDGLSDANVPITVQSFASSGHSEWRFYAEPNFEGSYVCQYASLESVRYTSNYDRPVRSVMRGC